MEVELFGKGGAEERVIGGEYNQNILYSYMKNVIKQFYVIKCTLIKFFKVKYILGGYYNR